MDAGNSVRCRQPAALLDGPHPSPTSIAYGCCSPREGTSSRPPDERQQRHRRASLRGRFRRTPRAGSPTRPVSGTSPLFSPSNAHPAPTRMVPACRSSRFPTARILALVRECLVRATAIGCDVSRHLVSSDKFHAPMVLEAVELVEGWTLRPIYGTETKGRQR